jgi:hypothetical protein
MTLRDFTTDRKSILRLPGQKANEVCPGGCALDLELAR